MKPRHFYISIDLPSLYNIDSEHIWKAWEVTKGSPGAIPVVERFAYDQFRKALELIVSMGCHNCADVAREALEFNPESK